MGKEKRGDPGSELPLTPVTLNILLALADEERHGYGIMLEVRDRTGARMGPGTLYSSIKRLVEGGLIEESKVRPAPESDDERRRYYRLTDFGRRVLAAEVGRLESTVFAARKKGAYPLHEPGTATGWS